jgi:uncharacterized membrane protein
VSTGRLEAFSDGVIAVAITLLVLNLVVPPPGYHGNSLGTNLGHEWPKFAAYAVSFLSIGIIWVNHHSMISRLRRADHKILVLNLLLLLSIGVLPFATNLMATYLNQSHGQHLAAVIYSGSFLFMGAMFANLNRHIMFGGGHELVEELTRAQRRTILARSVTGLAPYALAVIVAPFSSYASLVICGLLAAYYALPVASGR